MCIAAFVNKSYSDPGSVYNLINYVMKPDHVLNGYYGGIGVTYLNVEMATLEFNAVKHVHHKLEGRQMRHLYVSFDKSERVTPERAIYLGYKICEYFGNRYQIVFATHLNTPNIHLHFAINTVSYIDGKMYSEGPYDAENLRRHIEDITNFKCRWEY